MIIVSITGPSMSEALAQVSSSSSYADMFEFRLDLMDRPNIARLLSPTTKPTIATCRPIREGGKFTGSERERIGMLDLAAVFGAHYVDLELSASPSIINDFVSRKEETKVIVSHHVADGQPFSVRRLYTKLNATGADVIKLAFVAHEISENKNAFDFLKLAAKDKRQAVAIAMGDYGEPSRILYKKFGGWATYAAPEEGTASAPGQLRASLLRNVFRAPRLNRTTKVFGVIGNPLQQSKGIYLHNPLYARAKQNAVYCKFPVTDLSLFMRRLAPYLSGFSVTIPYKQSVMEYLDEVDDNARAIGAVNTVLRRGKRLVGSNSDAPAALDAIERVVRVKGKHLLIIGAGGAARAIAFEAKQRGAIVLIANRTEAKAQRLAREFGLGHVRMAQIRSAPFDILVNATSVGMVPNVDESPVPKKILKGKIVFDAVYNPPMTKLLRDAKSVGATIIQGTEMYLNQAARQFELYTGIGPRLHTMRRILAQRS
jgi:3-dehydroquinate dehydratase/shikimate dehydrogenase